jgi:transketolase
MAIAGVWQAATFNRPGYQLFDYDVYALCGDGCLMEGIGAEAASLAGHLRLSNLCWIYDNNKITIEGSTDLAFSQDVPTRFAGYGWAVQHVADANDLEALVAAFDAFRAEPSRPTLIVVDSVIGYGAPNKQGTHGAHGEPLGEAEVRAPQAVLRLARGRDVPRSGRGAQPCRWRHARAQRWAAPGVGGAVGPLRRRVPGPRRPAQPHAEAGAPRRVDADLPSFPADSKGLAGRDAGGKALNAVAQRVPWLVGGSADLAPSNKSRLIFAGAGDFGVDDRAGRNLHFGVREHAAAAVANGLALSKLRAFQAGFLIFSDFQRGALRLSALMELPVIHIYTHDSIVCSPIRPQASRR